MKALLLAVTFLNFFHLCRAGENKGANASPVYTVAELPTASGADFLQPSRINNRGEVLGKLNFSSGPFAGGPHVGLFSSGVTTDLHLLVAGSETNRWSSPIDLNDLGQAVFYIGGVFDRSFLYETGALV